MLSCSFFAQSFFDVDMKIDSRIIVNTKKGPIVVIRMTCETDHDERSTGEMRPVMPDD